MALVSMSEYARLRGVSEGTVRRAVKLKILIKSVQRSVPPGGKRAFVIIDSDLADLEWPPCGQEMDLKLLKESENAPDAEPDLESDEPDDSLENSDDILTKKVETRQNYAESRASREAYAAKLAQLSFEEKSGKLVDADEVKREAFKIGRQIRDTLMSIPDRVAAEFAAETNQFKIHTRLIEEIRKALSSLKDDAP
jgi:phage terminase Nu1 subunit (DNA packaging protein)